jgi:Arc/MetJ-type ribon-helix-helix transcriptional regulator
MSKKKIEENSNKTERFSIKINKQDKAIIKEKAKKAGYGSTSSYIRDVLLEKNIIPRADKEMILQVRKIGVNINQLTKLSNEKGNPDMVYNDIKSNVDLLIKLVSNVYN